MALIAGAALAAVMDRDEALTRARAVRDRVSSGGTHPLWPQFTDRLRAVLRDSVSFATMADNIHQSLGAIDSVLEEEVTVTESTVVVRSRCRFAKSALPLNVTVAFVADGHINTLLVRPDLTESKEYPSAFLDYVTKTRFTLPFRGEWLVVWGGRTLGQNYHAAIRGQRFAHDLIMVKDGKSHAGEGKALTDYYCYGQPVLAPAEGVVVTAVDSLPDQGIGARDPVRPAGNHVVINHGNHEFTLLAHMQPHSLRVKAGQRVKRGDVLGLAGNSGNTSEPHLHVHLMNGPDMTDADGLPMPFTNYLVDGKAIARGEIVRFQLVRPRAQ